MNHSQISIRLWSLLVILASNPLEGYAQPLRPPIEEKITETIARKFSIRNGALVLAVTDGHKHRLFQYGKVSQKEKKLPDENTLFEIGSISKVFSCLLLADLKQHNKLAYNSPVKTYLPANTIVPNYDGKEITVFHLATHSSGLERDPFNLPKNGIYSQAEFHRYLRQSKLSFSPGSKYLYSNVGYKLLGEALENAGGKPFAQLLDRSILSPLKLERTYVVVDDSQLKNLADGHDERGNLMPSSAQRGGASGGLKSCAGDLLNFLDFCIINSKRSSSKYLNDTLKYRRRISGNLWQCLGWVHFENTDTYSKYGLIDGYSSSILFSPSKQIGIVVLSSTLQIDATKLSEEILRIISNRKGTMF